MKLDILVSRLAAPALVAALAATAFVVARASESAWAEPAPAYELVPLPEGLDTLTSLEDAAARVRACTEGCAQVVYVWSPRMPLSRSGIPHVARAARDVGAGLTLVGFEHLERFAEAGRTGSASATRLGEALLAAGALTHAPALVIFSGSGVAGSAILGYKSAEAYASLIDRRLTDAVEPDGTESASGSRPPTGSSGGLTLPASAAPAAPFTDYAAVGVPGAYFKWVPGRSALAYESDRRIYILDLASGRSHVAPGYVDFVPTPDGLYFVTPGPGSVGLVFFDTDEVFDGALSGRTGQVRPIFTDASMRDQYPSVGILSDDEASVRYRILTSWFEGLVYRDYEVTHAQGGLRATVRPLGAPTVPCEGRALSTPIMSQDGQEVAARDEASGFTKIYRILSGGRCEEVLSLGMPTRKVAWHASGTKLAFSTPRVGTASSAGAAPGIFVYDRERRRVTRVADSEGASQLAFPEFLGDDAIAFMVPGRGSGQSSYFRVVEPLP